MLFRNCIFLAAGAALGLAGGLLAAGAPPTEHSGLTVEALGQVAPESLQAQIGLEGQILRLRSITIAPGGQIAKHDHATRAGLVKVLSGEVIEGRPEGETAWSAGQASALVEAHDTVHWFFNRGDVPAELLVCDTLPAG